jgi:clan AA aspartic protease (TIGR02281 family)
MRATKGFGGRSRPFAGLMLQLLMIDIVFADARGSPTDGIFANRCATANVMCRDGDSLCSSYRQDFESQHLICPGVNAPVTDAERVPASIPDNSYASRSGIKVQNNDIFTNRCTTANVMCRDGNPLCASYRKDFESQHVACPGVNAPATDAYRAPIAKPANLYGSRDEVNAQIPSRSESFSVSGESVLLVRENGVLKVPVRINNSITLNFILDSGAADVQIPDDVARTLIRMKTIGSDDYLGQGTYILADGAQHRESRISIRTLRIGNVELNNVMASVGDTRGELLLGQSFLRKLRSWSIDNDRGVLVLQVRSAK